jgi:hypothetical protein
MIKGKEVHEMKSGRLSNVEIKSHSGLESQPEDTIGQALKELVVKEVRMARIQMIEFPLFTKMAMERLMLGLHPRMRRKGSKTADSKRLDSYRHPLERVDRKSETRF